MDFWASEGVLSAEARKGMIPWSSKVYIHCREPCTGGSKERVFEVNDLELRYISGNMHLWAYLGPREATLEWFSHQVYSWTQVIKPLIRISAWHSYAIYAGLGTSLQLNLQYLQRTVLEVRKLIRLKETDLIDFFFTDLFEGEDVDINMYKILVYSVNHDALGILDPISKKGTDTEPKRLDVGNW